MGYCQRKYCAEHFVKHPSHTGSALPINVPQKNPGELLPPVPSRKPRAGSKTPAPSGSLNSNASPPSSSDDGTQNPPVASTSAQGGAERARTSSSVPPGASTSAPFNPPPESANPSPSFPRSSSHDSFSNPTLFMVGGALPIPPALVHPPFAQELSLPRSAPSPSSAFGAFAPTQDYSSLGNFDGSLEGGARGGGGASPQPRNSSFSPPPPHHPPAINDAMQLDEDNSIPTSGQRDKGKGRADAGTDEDEEDDEEDLDQCAVNGATTVKEGTKNTRFIKWRNRDQRFSKDKFATDASKRNQIYSTGLATILHEIRRLDIRTGAVTALFCADPYRIFEPNLSINPYTLDEATNTVTCKYKKEPYNCYVSHALCNLAPFDTREETFGSPVLRSGKDVVDGFNAQFNVAVDAAKTGVTLLEKFKLLQAAKDLKRDRQMKEKNEENKRLAEENRAQAEENKRLKEQAKQHAASLEAYNHWAAQTGYTGPLPPHLV